MPRRILIVDDELAGLRMTHVEGSVSNFYEVVADPTDPRFENLRDVAQTVVAAQAFVGDDASAAAYFATDGAVRDLLLSPQVEAGATAQLRALLEPLLGRAKRVERLRQDFLSAFPAPDFTVDFVDAPRPNLDVVSQSEAVFLDLFLEDGSPAPIDDVKQYLRGLSDQAGEAVLPPIALMSTHNELNEHRRNFSESARISAAGLMILPKGKIAEEQFGSTGLRLSFDQLSRQSSVAHSMRLFMASWMRALERATAETAKTVWNLDASAMQQVHLASVRDDDPYDEHLGELLSREHLYRVESDSEVGSRIRALDASFREHLEDDPREIGNRLIAPMTDVANARALMSHFTWLGSLPSVPLLAYLDAECAERISRSLPFGSVLCGPTLAEKSRCLLHITQQCDLNGASRTKDPTATLIFAVAEAQELLPSDNPPATGDLVLKSLHVDEGSTAREFDLRVLPGEIAAMPLRDFIARVRHQRLRIVGRLRSDITHQVVAATSNYISRPASQLMLRPGLLRSKVFLQSAKLKNGRVALTGGAGGKARVFSLTKDKDFFSFQDDACVDIALWLAQQLVSLNVKVEVDPLCTALRKGWRSERNLPGGLHAKVRDYVSLDDAWKALIKDDVSAGQMQLTVVSEK